MEKAKVFILICVGLLWLGFQADLLTQMQMNAKIPRCLLGSLVTLTAALEFSG